MAAVSYSQRLDLTAIRALLTSPQGGVVRDLLRRGLLIETQAKRNLAGVGGPKRIDNGILRASINAQPVMRNGDPAVLVGTNVKYALFVHKGTGIYGPKARRIRPRSAKALVWSSKTKYAKKKGKFAGKVVVRSTAGMEGNPFLKNALPAARG